MNCNMKPNKTGVYFIFSKIRNSYFIYLPTQTKLLVGPLKRKLQDWTSLHKVKKASKRFL